MIYYLFEDKKESKLSSFIMEALAPDKEHAVDFVGGNTNLKSKSDEYLATGAQVYAFLDTVPGNPCIDAIYYDLLALQRDNSNFMLIPIVCAEYYLLKSLELWQFGHVTDDLFKCLNKDVYFDIAYAVKKKHTAYESKYYSFEQLCKKVISSHGNWCIRSKKSSSSPDKKDMNETIGLYYTKDCPCIKAKKSCGTMSHLDKLHNLLRGYPCFPVCNLFVEHTHVFSKNELLSLCDQLIMNHNEFTNLLRDAVEDTEKKFFQTLILPSKFCKQSPKVTK